MVGGSPFAGGGGGGGAGIGASYQGTKADTNFAASAAWVKAVTASAIAAAVGDKILWAAGGLWENQGITGRGDIAAYNGASLLRQLGNASYGLTPLQGPASVSMCVGHSGLWIVEAGDLVGGQVTLSFILKADSGTSKTMRANVDEPIWFSCLNVRQ